MRINADESMNATTLSRREMLKLASRAAAFSCLSRQGVAGPLSARQNQSGSPANSKLGEPCQTLPRTVALLEKLQNDKLQIGSQFYLSRHGQPLADFALGQARRRAEVGFCDPEYGLVVAFVLNGMPGVQPHNQRMLALANAIYFDLGLAKEGDAGRPRELPKAG